MFAVDKINLYHECFYNYRRRAGSLSNEKVRLNKTFLLEQVAMTRDILQRYNLEDKLKKEYIRYKMRFIYELEKGTDAEFKAEFITEARKYLTDYEYFRLMLKKYVKLIFRNIFKLEKRYQSTEKTRITILGLSFII